MHSRRNAVHTLLQKRICGDPICIACSSRCRHVILTPNQLTLWIDVALIDLVYLIVLLIGTVPSPHWQYSVTRFVSADDDRLRNSPTFKSVSCVIVPRPSDHVRLVLGRANLMACCGFGLFGSPPTIVGRLASVGLPPLKRAK